MSGDHGNNKVMTAAEAVSRFVKKGDVIAFGGFVTNRRPYALVRELLRQGTGELIVEGGPSGGDVDMLIGAGLVSAINVSYIANSGFTQVCRRFRAAVEAGTLPFEDYSLDVQTIMYHAAALGLPYVPVKNMLGSDLADKWGISREERKKYPKLPPEKFVIREDPFHPGKPVLCLPVPEIDAAFIHAQAASPDGTVRIMGAPFQDIDIAMAARHTVVSCEHLMTNEEIRRHPELNSLTGLCVDAVVRAPCGAHPSQCFGEYDYDPELYREYDAASRTEEGFRDFVRKYVTECPDHDSYLKRLGEERLSRLKVRPDCGYVPGIREVR